MPSSLSPSFEGHPPAAEFDSFARNYDAELNAGLAVTGEGKEYYASTRVTWLARRLAELGVGTDRVLDFGCGTGSGIPFLHSGLGARSILGVDVSDASLAEARADHEAEQIRFARPNEVRPDAEFDLAFTNGVFHHIPPEERSAAVAYVYRALKPGGIFALWENNPWNPGTRYIMSRVAFDRDAITLTPPETRALLRAGGFEILHTDFLFIFPRTLRFFRSLEPRLARWPLGGQYEVLARKPE